MAEATKKTKQEAFREKLANWLSISYEELEEFGEEVEPNLNKTKVNKWEYFILFSKDTPASVKKRINRLTGSNKVYFNLEELENPAH